MFRPVLECDVHDPCVSVVAYFHDIGRRRNPGGFAGFEFRTR
jgi:membrane-associated HD superfamily phosphohydrolase